METTKSAMRRLLSRCVPGDVLEGTVAATAPDGVEVCVNGARLWLPRSRIARSPACGPERFRPGEHIFAAVWQIDHAERAILLTHRELLGTFDELTPQFMPGTVCEALVIGNGLLELTPNLLAEAETDLPIGTAVRFCPERYGSVQLIGSVVGRGDRYLPRPFTYYITNGRIKHWLFRPMHEFFCREETIFCQTPPRDSWPLEKSAAVCYNKEKPAKSEGAPC